MAENPLPRVLVLGAFGFIGRHLVRSLAADGYPVTVFGHASHGHFPNGGANIRYRHGDFANLYELRAAIEGAEVVFHLIGNTVPQSSNDNPRFDVDAHIGPTISLLDACVAAGVRHIIFTSSGGTVYGIPRYTPIDEEHPTFPISSYGIQKVTIEHYLRLYQRIHGLPATVLRIANPYGPGQNIGRNQGLIGTVCSKLVRGEVLDVWGDGSVVRDYIYIDDVVAALRAVMLETPGYSVYNLGSGKGTSITQLLAAFEEAGLPRVGVRFREARPVDIPVNVLDTSRIGARFGWRPTIGLTDGIVAAYRAFRDGDQ